MTESQHQPELPAVEIEGVSYSYPPGGVGEPGVEALRDISMRVEPHSRLGILGPNGGGKSTLIQIVLGVLEPTAGRVRVFGMKPAQARREGLIGYLPQRIGADLDWPLSVEQVIAMPRRTRLRPWLSLGSEDHDAIDRAMQLLEVEDLRDRRIGSLSGGQLQRVMIARAISTTPRLLVLDEPMLGVDISGQQRFASLIDAVSTELGLTTIVVTHDMRALVAVADRVACLSRTLHFHDAPEGLTPAVLAQVFAHDIEPILGELHIDAHTASECDDPTHEHTHTHDCDHDHGGAS
ncbi:MAG: ABC transporter [Phycisphaerae bacterium]|nr:ABC transporter [Phycisphaerae bacterium]MBM91070.1 ABC transporter [Phycisphaerae bacterium]HCT45601.1 ABC transporter [Phycisphaerales bacterium]